MPRISFMTATAAMAILVAPLLSPASAGQRNSANTNQTATSHAFGLAGSAGALSLNNNAVEQGNFRLDGGKPHAGQSNGANTVSTALSTALSVGGDAGAASFNTNLTGQDNIGASKHPIVQLNSAPTVQTAVGTAVSIGGDASAEATNSNGGLQHNSR